MSKIPDPLDTSRLHPLEIKVTHSLDEASSRFRTLVQKDGVLQEYKKHQKYEKPSVKKKMKSIKAQQQKQLLAKKERMILSGELDAKKKKKEEKRLAAIKARQDEKKSISSSGENL